MYDMYPWDDADSGDYPPAPLRSWRKPSRQVPAAPMTRLARALQVALDRRDNGGQAADEAGKAAARRARQ